MRLYLLFEDVNVAAFRQQLETLSKQIDVPEQEIISWIEYIDNTGKTAPWILKQIKYQNIIMPEDKHRIKETIQNFYKHHNKLTQKDINQYKTIHQLEQQLEQHEETAKKGFQTNPNTLPGVTKLNQDGNIILWEITNPDSLEIMGLGTKWCTRKDYKEPQAKKYINQYKVIYIISEDSKPIIQFTPDFEQIMDTNDEETTLTQHRELLKPIENKNPKSVCNYSRLVIGGRWPEAEPYIMKDPESAYRYACDVIDGRWPKAESIIMKDPYYAYLYAYNVIKGRWPEAEPIIMKDPESAYNYVRWIIGDRWSEAEKHIIKDFYFAYVYARDVVKGRWSEAEPIIMKNPEYAFYYARDIIKGRWPEAEKHIMKDPEFAYFYARYIIQGRWPEAEKHIMKNPKLAYEYRTTISHL